MARAPGPISMAATGAGGRPVGERGDADGGGVMLPAEFTSPHDASLTQGSFTAVKIHCNVTMNLLSLRLSGLCEFVACSREQGSDSREQHTEPNTPCSVLVLAFRHPLLYFTHPPSLYNNIYLRLQSTGTRHKVCVCVCIVIKKKHALMSVPLCWCCS